MYTFWKLEILTNCFSFFVGFIQGPKTHVLSPTSLLSGGTHPHFLYGEVLFTFPFLATFSFGRGIGSTLGFCPFFLLSHLQSTTKLLLMEKWRPQSSSSPWRLPIDTIFEGNHSFQDPLWASFFFLKNFQVSPPPNLLDLYSSSLGGASSPLLEVLSSYFMSLVMLGFVMGVLGILYRLLIWLEKKCLEAWFA